MLHIVGIVVDVPNQTQAENLARQIGQANGAIGGLAIDATTAVQVLKVLDPKMLGEQGHRLGQFITGLEQAMPKAPAPKAAPAAKVATEVENDKETNGITLKEARIAANLSQTELADLAGYPSRSSISNYECRGCNATILETLLEVIAEAASKNGHVELKEARIAAEMTQVEAADALGVSRSTIARLESGNRPDLVDANYDELMEIYGN